jgi:nucleoside-diphosphate-sugar epimerase
MDRERRVLITGGAGFVGSNLASRLIRDGAFVDCVDSLVTGRIDSIQALRSSERFRFFRQDVSHADFVQLGLTNRYTEIYHLACPTGVPNIRTLGEEMVQACSHGTEHVLRIACAHDARLVYTSSAEVYGDPEESPQREVYCGKVDPTGPRSAYEEGKRFGETLVRLYADKYRVEGKIVRIFNTYGPGMSPDDTRVIPRFLRHIRDQRKIVVYGDGKQTRTHLYVDDLIEALVQVAHDGARGEVYNIGGDRELSILELVDVLRTLTPLPVEVEHEPHFIEDHRGRLPATTKVRGLGWAPRVPLADGLRRMLESYGMPISELADDRITRRTRRRGITGTVVVSRPHDEEALAQ